LPQVLFFLPLLPLVIYHRNEAAIGKAVVVAAVGVGFTNIF